MIHPPWKRIGKTSGVGNRDEDVNEMKFTYPMGTLLIRVVSTYTSGSLPTAVQPVEYPGSN